MLKGGFEFCLAHGYVYRVIYGGKKVVLCEGGHLQVGSALKANGPDEFEARVNRWLAQYTNRVNSHSNKKGRGRK